MAERVLTLRELNRATLARQLLLERKRLSPTAVIELVDVPGAPFLVDGFVAGTWRVEDGRVVAEPFETLSPAVERELQEEAGRLEAFLAD